jgi:hypothetical protein
MQINLNKYISLVFYGHIGYPFIRKLKFDLIAPSGYAWRATGKKELTAEYQTDVFSISAGFLLRMKNPAASSGVSSVEKKKSYGLFSLCTGGLLPRHHWRRN